METIGTEGGTAKPPFDLVNLVAHYNNHPSGIEAKVICRQLNFNLGNVFKYVFRREGKEAVRSLKSAVFYLKDHQTEWVSSSHAHRDKVRTYFRLDSKVWKLEEDLRYVSDSDLSDLASQFYTAFNLYVTRGQYQHYHYEWVLETLNDLIAHHEALEALKAANDSQATSTSAPRQPPLLRDPSGAGCHGKLIPDSMLGRWVTPQ
jgi:hypothetical protein